MIGPVGMKALMACREKELATWKTWASKRFEAKEHGGLFKTEFLEPEEADAIRAELAKSSSLDQLMHVFTSRRKRLPEVRIAPPRAGDAAHLKNDLKTALRGVLEAEAHRIARNKEE